MAKHRGEEEEKENHERWLISYADMLTLLFALFVILYAMSQVNEKKFDQISQSLAVAFGRVVNITNGNDSLLPKAGTNLTLSEAPPISPTIVSPQVMPPLREQVSGQMTDPGSANATAGSMAAQAAKKAAAADTATLDKAEAQVSQAVQSAGLSGKVLLSREERGLVVTLLVDDVIFQAHRAELLPEGQKIISSLLPTLTANGNQLIVEGHTNTAKVRPKYYPSEWELSSARAGSVARFLNDTGGIPRERMYVAGYGDTSPLVPESNPDHLRLNRRVDIVVTSSLTDDQRAALAVAQASDAQAAAEAAAEAASQ